MIKIGVIYNGQYSNPKYFEFTHDHFPDGTLRASFHSEIFTGFCHNNIEFEIMWNYESDSEIWSLYNIVNEIREVDKDYKIYLDMPYVPNARQDRRIEDNNSFFTLKHFCKFINDLNFTSIVITDPHSNVTPALLNNCYARSPKDSIRKVANMILDSKKDFMFFPDEGAMKRYKISEYKSMCGMKTRDLDTGKITKYSIVDNGQFVRRDNLEKYEYISRLTSVLIVDDICSYGGTFIAAAKKLREEYFIDKIYLYVTHCENSILKGELLTSGLIDKVFTTKSIFTKKHEKIIFVEDM